MNVFTYAIQCEQQFENFLNSTGKQRKTTLFADLSIAECYGAPAVKETYNRVMEDWGDNLEFMCEWAVALNQKIWQHYDNNQTLARVYDELWRKADEYCCKHFKDDELSAYYSYID